MRPYSLTRRLITAALLVEFCSTLALVGIASGYEGISHFHAFDVMLRGRADSMLGAVQDAEDPQDNVMLDGTQGLAPRRDIYIVRDERGRVLGQQNWQGAEQVVAGADAREFRNLQVNGTRYRVIRKVGLRMVDPGDAGGGIARHVTILYGSPTHPVWERVRNTIAFYACTSLLLLIVSGLIMFYLLRRGLEPLHELAGQASQVSVDTWSFGPSSRARNVRELAPLVSALETALHGLERSFAQQKRFVGDAAHELKTSVAVLKSSLQLLTMKSRSAVEYEVGLERVQLDCERMEELVQSMLTLAGLEGEDTRPEASHPIELGDILRDVAEHFRTLAEVADVRITVHAQEPVGVLGDRERLRLLCSNLMHNALQHSPRGAEIRVVIKPNAGKAELLIEDQGSGIPAEVLPHVFDRFYRGDPSRSRRTGGTGLGLSIVKAIVLRLHGEVHLESELGRGTRAVVRLPSTLHDPAEARVTGSSGLLNWTEKEALP